MHLDPPSGVKDDADPRRPDEADQRPSLWSNSLWTITGTVYYAVAQWGILVVLAKLTDPEQLGRFALALALTAPVFILTNLQLRVVLATDVRAGHPFSVYLWLRLVMTLVGFCVVWLLTLAAGYRGGVAAVVLLVGLAKCFEAISEIMYGLYQQQERMDRLGLSLLLKGSISLGGFWLAVRWSGDVAWGAAALAAVWALLLVTFDVPAAMTLLRTITGSAGRLARSPLASMRASFRPRSLSSLAILAAPLGLVSSLISLTTNIPRYALEAWKGEATLGIFAALAYLMTAGGIIVNAIGQSAAPRLARYHASGDRAAYLSLLLRLGAIALALGVLGIAVALVFGKPLLRLIYTAEYAAHSSLLVALMIAAAVNHLWSVLWYAVSAARRFRVQIFLFSTSSLLNAIASWLLVPRYGLLGAAGALIASAMCNLAGAALIQRQVLRGFGRA